MDDDLFSFEAVFSYATLKKILIGLAILFVLLFIKSQTVDFIESYEAGYKYNLCSGHMTRINRTGYVFHEPWFVEVNAIDLRPMQVCINANSRVLNCKLVRFNPAGTELFLSWHGRQNYSQTDLEPILMSYAYENAGHTYPFLTVIREMRTQDGPASQ